MSDLEQLKVSAAFVRSRINHEMYQDLEVMRALLIDTVGFLDQAIALLEER